MFKLIKLFFRLIKWPVIILVTLGVIAWFYPEKFLTVDSGPVTADAIILVGGGQHERAARAVELYNQHAAPRIIITGAGDAEINQHMLIAKGVPANVIQIENKSTTTYENAEFSRKLLQAGNIHSAILVTSWYHARRAEKTFAHLIPGIKFYSRPTYYGFDRAEWKNELNKRMRLEFLKLPGYWIRYGVNPF